MSGGETGGSKKQGLLGSDTNLLEFPPLHFLNHSLLSSWLVGRKMFLIKQGFLNNGILWILVFYCNLRLYISLIHQGLQRSRSTKAFYTGSKYIVTNSCQRLSYNLLLDSAHCLETILRSVARAATGNLSWFSSYYGSLQSAQFYADHAIISWSHGNCGLEMGED